MGAHPAGVSAVTSTGVGASTGAVRAAALDIRRGRQPWRFVARYVVMPIGTILITSFLVFAALSLTPGDPVAQILGGKASAQQRMIVREQLGLDEPLIVRYFRWLGAFVRGDMGTSYTYHDSVSAVILPRLEVTLQLVAYSAMIIVIVGIGLGLVGGLVTRIRPVVAGAVALLISVPSYVAATALLGVFAVSLRWFPSFGAGSPGGDRIWHLTLPAIALSVSWIAYMAQISMASIDDQRSMEHVRTAVGRGLPPRLVVGKHVLRNAGVSIVTAAGLTLAALVAGSVIVETAFTLDGVGSLLVRSVGTKDVPVVLAVSVLIVTVYVVVVAIVDLLSVVLDPSLRDRKAKA